jgi:hypothetical protein
LNPELEIKGNNGVVLWTLSKFPASQKEATMSEEPSHAIILLGEGEVSHKRNGRKSPSGDLHHA